MFDCRVLESNVMGLHQNTYRTGGKLKHETYLMSAGWVCACCKVKMGDPDCTGVVQKWAHHGVAIFLDIAVYPYGAYLKKHNWTSQLGP